MLRARLLAFHHSQVLQHAIEEMKMMRHKHRRAQDGRRTEALSPAASHTVGTRRRRLYYLGRVVQFLMSNAYRFLPPNRPRRRHR